MATLEERHPWTLSLAKTAVTAPKGSNDASSVLWTVQLPVTVDVSALDACTWTRHGEDAWTTTVDGTEYVMEPATSSSPSYVVDDGNLLQIKVSMVVRVAIDGDNVGKEAGGHPPSEPSPDDRKKKKKKKKSK
jgi:hypothetical protein